MSLLNKKLLSTFKYALFELVVSILMGLACIRSYISCLQNNCALKIFLLSPFRTIFFLSTVIVFIPFNFNIANICYHFFCLLQARRSLGFIIVIIAVVSLFHYIRLVFTITQLNMLLWGRVFVSLSIFTFGIVDVRLFIVFRQ